VLRADHRSLPTVALLCSSAFSCSRRTLLGQTICAFGDNERTTCVAGIHTHMIDLCTFLLAGLNTWQHANRETRVLADAYGF
jgi:ribose/xylose/arabinose/galactoside ABC-type transport system permease subunit